MPTGVYERTRRSIAERFWCKVTRAIGCWTWAGSKTRQGYGCIGSGGKYAPVVKAHRVSWELNRGPIPQGLCVLHHCDNPSCVNPNHLFLGTVRDNWNDAITKGRAVPYNRNHRRYR